MLQLSENELSWHTGYNLNLIIRRRGGKAGPASSGACARVSRYDQTRPASTQQLAHFQPGQRQGSQNTTWTQDKPVGSGRRRGTYIMHETGRTTMMSFSSSSVVSHCYSNSGGPTRSQIKNLGTVTQQTQC